MPSWQFMVLLVGVMLLVAAVTIRSGLMLRRWTPPFNLLLNWPDNLVRLALTALLVYLGIRSGPGPAAWRITPGSLGGTIVAGVAGGVVLAGVLAAAGNFAIRHWGPEIYSNRMLQCMLPVHAREWLGILPALLIAASMEEVIFRWLPLAGLSGLVSPWWLLWPLALFFGVLHWPQGWWGIAGTTLAGIMLSLLFLATASLWPPLIAHYLMNVLQLALAQWTGVRPLRGTDC